MIFKFNTTTKANVAANWQFIKTMSITKYVATYLQQTKWVTEPIGYKVDLPAIFSTLYLQWETEVYVLN